MRINTIVKMCHSVFGVQPLTLWWTASVPLPTVTNNLPSHRVCGPQLSFCSFCSLQRGFCWGAARARLLQRGQAWLFSPAFTAVCVHIAPTSPHLVCSFFLLSFQFCVRRNAEWDDCLIFSHLNLSACSFCVHINLTVSLLNLSLPDCSLSRLFINHSRPSSGGVLRSTSSSPLLLLKALVETLIITHFVCWHSVFLCLLCCPSHSTYSCLKSSACCLDQIAFIFNVWWLTNNTVSLSSLCLLLLPLLLGLYLIPVFFCLTVLPGKGQLSAILHFA